MKLGFVTAILPDLELADILVFAAKTGYDCVEVMCWPPGKAERRHAGVTHIDLDQLDAAAIKRVQQLCATTGVSISGLGYYPNPLSNSATERDVAIAHLEKVIKAAPKLGVSVVNTFVGRDPSKSVEQNWGAFVSVWKPLVKLAEKCGVQIGIENCPMLFTKDEWPGGKNLATSPTIWRRMYEEIPSANFGLNYDPSHLLWQRMDYLKPIREFAKRLVHVHAKDAQIEAERLNEVGILAYPNEFHTPKLPGLGDVDWLAFFEALVEADYQGAVCVEVEDRAYEGSLESRKLALEKSIAFLRRFVPQQKEARTPLNGKITATPQVVKKTPPAKAATSTKKSGGKKPKRS